MMNRHQIFCTESDRPTTNNEFLQEDNQAILRGGKFGHCLVCGLDVYFQINHPNLRESLVCPVCKSYNRQRQLVATISLSMFGGVYDLKEILHKLKGSKILMLESVTNLAEAFKYYGKGLVELHTTEYIADTMESGETSNDGIVHLNIQDPHFSESYFDVIIHADVFEHVSDAPKAEEQQLKLLKKKGKVFYTAPFVAELDKDDVRAMIKRGKLVHMGDPIYHGDPSPRQDVDNNKGCLVFRIFSYPELLQRSKSLGASFKCYHLYAGGLGIIGNNAYVFEIIKAI